jgi:TPR repeat protein
VFGYLFSLPTAHAEPKRLALVIGNANYVQGDVLPNDINDADDMAALLQQYNFSVIKKTDATLKDMFDGLREFKQALQQSPDRVGLFYYSGHGLEVDGTQYIIPINAQPRSETELPAHAIAVNTVLKEMGEGKEQLNVVILDACRNNPFSKAFAIKSLSKGFSPISNAPRGTLIASATAAGDTSSANGSRNSVYTAQLLKFLREQPTDEIRLVLSDVRKAVLDDTHDGQMPWTSESMTGRFFLVPPTNTVNQAIQPVIAPVAEIKPLVSEPSVPVQQIPEPIPETKPPVSKPSASVQPVVTPVSEPTTNDAQNRLISMEAEMVKMLKEKGETEPYFHENCEKELAFWQENAKRNNPIAQSFLGGCYREKEYMLNDGAHSYEDNKGVPKSDVKAMDWYRKAAEQGYAIAQDELGLILLGWEGRDDNARADAINWFRKAAEQAYALGQYHLGTMLYINDQGLGNTPYTEAITWYIKAVAQGNDKEYQDIKYDLGQMYEKSVPANNTEAAYWYIQAAKSTLSGRRAGLTGMALEKLSEMYEHEKGVSKSDIEAVWWYLKTDYSEAQYRLGLMYENGKGVSQSDAEAADWYSKAADNDHSNAQYRLGLMYENGKGVSQNDLKARNLYLHAIRDNTEAAYRLGVMYEEGKGVPKDAALAGIWYCRSIALNKPCPDSQGISRHDAEVAIEKSAKK